MIKPSSETGKLIRRFEDNLQVDIPEWDSMPSMRSAKSPNNYITLPSLSSSAKSSRHTGDGWEIEDDIDFEAPIRAGPRRNYMDTPRSSPPQVRIPNFYDAYTAVPFRPISGRSARSSGINMSGSSGMLGSRSSGMPGYSLDDFLGLDKFMSDEEQPRRVRGAKAIKKTASKRKSTKSSSRRKSTKKSRRPHRSAKKSASRRRSRRATEKSASRRKSTKKSSSRRKSVKKSSSRRKSTKKSASKRKSTKKSASKRKSTKKSASRRKSTKKSASKRKSTKKSASKRKSTKKSASRRKSTKKSASKRKSTKKSASKRKSTKKSASRRKSTKKSASKRKSTKKSASAYNQFVQKKMKTKKIMALPGRERMGAIAKMWNKSKSRK